VIALGLDLGQVGDFAALAALEQVGEALHARHLDRWRRVSYPDTVRRVAALFATPELKGAVLVVDATGVGLAVYQELREAMPNVRILGASVTSGASVSSKGDGRFGVPKVDLIDACRLLLEQGKLRISEQLPLAKVLIQEFIDYRVRITKAANETFGAASGAHDDLLFSVALAAWYFSAVPQPYTGPLVCWPGHWPGDGPEPMPEPPADVWSALKDLGVDPEADWDDVGWR
jgi:hypothetical protein